MTDVNLKVASELTEVARLLDEAPTPDATWQRIVELAVSTLDGCEFAGVSLVQPLRIDTPAATDDVVTRVDAIQYETGQGPCLESIRDEETLVSDDLETELRWPAFTERAVRETNIRSMLAFRLFVRDETLGALNLYSMRKFAFDERATSVGALFAAHAALAMSNAEQRQHAGHMDEALASSRTIGLALGILMAQSQVDRNRAFSILSEASQRSNVKIRDLAETIVTSVEARAT